MQPLIVSFRDASPLLMYQGSTSFQQKNEISVDSRRIHMYTLLKCLRRKAGGNRRIGDMSSFLDSAGNADNYLLIPTKLPSCSRASAHRKAPTSGLSKK